MRLLLLLAFAVGVFSPGRTETLSEDDGFRRLLRRASVEADRPLVREQRRNKDDDDEDGFGDVFDSKPSSDQLMRSRRAEEDNFYHTLLDRAESKHLAKRSFDSEDSDSKSGYIIREDWTGGDGKISDADREELQSLFQKLNTDVSGAKSAAIRSTEEDSTDSSVDGAAKDYARWLMNQPANEIGKALSHKAEVDHKLTQLFFQDKRGNIPGAKRHDNDANKRMKMDEEDYPTKVKYPEPIHWKSRKKSEAPVVTVENINNKTNDNCSTAECLCERTCKPHAVVSAAPCECSSDDKSSAEPLANNTNSNVITASLVSNTKPEKAATDKATKALAAAGPKLCNDDSPQCLCTRACYPRGVAALTPCSCLGEKTANLSLMQNATAQETATANALKTSRTSPHSIFPLTHTVSHRKVLEPHTTYPLFNFHHPQNRASTTNRTNSAQSISNFNKNPQVVQTPSLNIDVPKNTTVQNVPSGTVDPFASSWCQQACGTMGVASDNPCKCLQLPVVNTSPAVPAAPVVSPPVSITNFPPRAPEFSSQQLNTQAASVVQPASVPEITAPVPGDVNAQVNPAYPVAPAPVVASLVAPAVAPVVAPAVAPVVAPAVQVPVITAQAFPYPSSPQVVPQAVTAAVQPVEPVYTAPVSAVVRTPNRPSTIAKAVVRTTKPDGKCAHTCHPKKVVIQSPCVCANANQTIPLPKTLAMKKAALESVEKSFQGCFKDRMPLRDLPKRFTRYETTPEACINECQYQNFKFAGVQYGYLCFCGDGFGRYGKTKDDDCNVACVGDPTRTCGAFWHNAVYSVDGKEYDPTDFDFKQLDRETMARDNLPGNTDQQNPAVRDFNNEQGANVASHLMKAAQAALKAAKKLLPSVAKKMKVVRKGGKVKRQDTEEDAEFMQEKMQAEASLVAAHQIIQKTNFGVDKRDAEREKRAIDEDSDPYDPNNGKDLLMAYMQNVDVYRRQVRSVDDEEEEEDPNAARKFAYRHMSVGENFEGEFVEKDDDVENSNNNNIMREVSTKKRSAEKEDVLTEVKQLSGVTVPTNEKDHDGSIEKRSVPAVSVPSHVEKRSVSTLSVSSNVERNSVLAVSEPSHVDKRSVPAVSVSSNVERNSVPAVSEPSHVDKRSVPEVSVSSSDKERSANTGNEIASVEKRYIVTGSSGKKRERRSVAGSGANQRQRRSLAGSGANQRQRRSLTGSGAGQKKKRSLSGSGANQRQKRSLSGSGANQRQRRSLTASGAGQKKKRFLSGNGANQRQRRSLTGSGAGQKKKRSLSGSGDNQRQRRFLTGSETNLRQRRSLTGSGANQRRRRSLSGSGANQRQRRSLTGSGAGQKKKRSLSGSGANQRKRRSVAGSGANQRQRRSLTGSGVNQIKKRSITGSGVNQRKRRDLTDNDIPEGAFKMAARGEVFTNNLRFEKRDQIPEDETLIDPEFEVSDAEQAGEDASGSGEEEDNVEESGSESGDTAVYMDRRDIESDLEELLVKRNTIDDTKNASVSLNSTAGNGTVNANLKSDVERGVDSLLNLVVELYKQQKTIKAFEASVRSLRHDILRELHVPKIQKEQATKKVRDQIQKTARERLHVLTSSIENKISEFARNHPEASKQANLAASLLPKIPMSQQSMVESKKEIGRRAAEFDNIEDSFTENTLPEILKEHFKRNAEPDIEDTRPRRKSPNGEEQLSRMHRDVQEIEQERAGEETDDDDEFQKLF